MIAILVTFKTKKDSLIRNSFENNTPLLDLLKNGNSWNWTNGFGSCRLFKLPNSSDESFK